MFRLRFVTFSIAVMIEFLSLPPSAVSQEVPYYAELQVTAFAVRASDASRTPTAANADVYINTVRVGRTPYQDGLPSGMYSLELRSENAAPYRETIVVEAGKSYTIQARLWIPLTAEEIRKQHEADQLQRQQALEEQQRVHEEWISKYGPLKKKKRTMHIIGGVLMGTGLVTMIPGAPLLASASEDNRTADHYFERWASASDPNEISFYALKVKEFEQSRDAKNVSGIVLLSAGGAILISGIVLSVIVPRVPEEPPNPNLAEIFDLDITPLIAPSFGGMMLRGRF